MGTRPGGDQAIGASDRDDVMDDLADEDDDAVSSVGASYNSPEGGDSYSVGSDRDPGIHPRVTTPSSGGDRTPGRTQEPLESLIAASQLSLTHAISQGLPDSTQGRLQASPNSPKLLIKDLASLGATGTTGPAGPAGAADGFCSSVYPMYHQHQTVIAAPEHDDQDYSDEDINVTDDMTASNNDDSDVD